MAYRTPSHPNDLTIIEPIPRSASSTKLYVEIQLKEHRHQKLRTIKHALCSPASTVTDLIREHFQSADLHDIPVKDIYLTKIGGITGPRHVTLADQSSTLAALAVKSDDKLLFEWIPPDYELEIMDPARTKKVPMKWNRKTTTLQMLLNYTIETFSLQSIERNHIHLLTMHDQELDIQSQSNQLLTDLNIDDKAWIFVQVDQPTSAASLLHVVCAHRDGDLSFDVPLTMTLRDLHNRMQQQLKDCHLVEVVFFNRMFEQIVTSSSDQRLCDLHPKPGHTLYARLTLGPSGNQSLTTRSNADQVTVSFRISGTESIQTKASIHDTVGDVIKTLVTQAKADPSTRLQLCCGSTFMSNDDSRRPLSSFGIQAGETIHAIVSKSTPTPHVTTNGPSMPLKLNVTPLGLANLGNTCYMNSALQCLAHVTPLTRFFLNGLTAGAVGDAKSVDATWNQFYDMGAVSGAYADFLRNLWLTSGTSYSYSPSFRPNHIKETIAVRAPRFATFDQQDAQEFLIFLIDEIHKEMREKHGPRSPTIIDELFFGTLQSTVTCSSCSHPVTTTHPMNFLPLPLVQPGRKFHITFIEKNGGRDMTIVNVAEDGSVKNLLEAYIDSRPSYAFLYNVIVMTDDGPIDSREPLRALPLNDVILIEEDKFSDSYSYSRYDRVRKPLTLDGCLREFCAPEQLEDSWKCPSETCKKQTGATKQLKFSSLPRVLIIQLKRFSHRGGFREKIDQFVNYPIKGLDLSSLLSSPQEAIYDLFAVTKHIGSIYGGHYIAYAHHEVEGRSRWYEFDDSWTKPIHSLAEDLVVKDAYLLFYIRRER